MSKCRGHGELWQGCPECEIERLRSELWRSQKHDVAWECGNLRSALALATKDRDEARAALAKEKLRLCAGSECDELTDAREALRLAMDIIDDIHNECGLIQRHIDDVAKIDLLVQRQPEHQPASQPDDKRD